MSRSRYLINFVGLIIFSVVFLNLNAWALDELRLQGKISGPGGEAVAGALISDGHQVKISLAKGEFEIKTRPGRILAITAPSGYAVKGDWWWPVEKFKKSGQTVNLVKVHYGKEIRIAALSDPHLCSKEAPPDWEVKPGYLETPMRTWAKVARQLKDFRPHLSLVAGDICMDAEHKKTAHTKAQMLLACQAVGMLPQPVRCLPGNHDVRYGFEEPWGVNLSSWRNYLGPSRQVYIVENICLIMLDNMHLGRNYKDKPKNTGACSEDTVNWLGNLVQVLPKDLHVLVLSHFPLFSPLSGVNPLRKGSLVKTSKAPGFALRNVDQKAKQVIELLGERPILGLINGHEHAYQTSTLFTAQGALRAIGLPSVCGFWWAGDMPFGSRKFPPGYLKIKLNLAGEKPVLDTEFVPVIYARVK